MLPEEDVTRTRSPHTILLVSLVGFVLFALGKDLYATAGLSIFAVTGCYWGSRMIQRGRDRYQQIVGYVTLVCITILLFIVLGGL